MTSTVQRTDLNCSTYTETISVTMGGEEGKCEATKSDKVRLHNLTRYSWPKMNVFCGGHILQGMTCIPHNLRRFTMVDHASYVLDLIHP